MGLRSGPGFCFIKSKTDKKEKVIKNLYQGDQAKSIKQQLPPMGKIHWAKIN
jgi:hypothetical protein